MSARAAHVKTLQGPAVIAVPEHRPGRKHLIEAQSAVEDITAHKSEGALQIKRTHDLPPEYCRLEVRRIGVDRIDHEIGYRLAMRIPRCAIGKLRGHMLAEKARDVHPARREAVIYG